MRVAYADPPYIGQARKHYRGDPLCAEVDHVELIARLEAEYDGWGLSCSVPSLKYVLSLCPDGVRVGAWTKRFAAGKPHVVLNYAWEPVILKPVRRPRELMVDWVCANAAIGSHRELRSSSVKGQKPEAFSYWLFGALGLRSGDVLEDLYPGSGAVSAAWVRWSRQMTMKAVGS